MSTKHAIAAARFLENKENEAWHDHTLWMVRTKRDKMSHSLPEWERLRELASEIKLYSNSHLDTLLEEFEKNAIANGAIVHWAKDAEEHNQGLLPNEYIRYLPAGNPCSPQHSCRRAPGL